MLEALGRALADDAGEGGMLLISRDVSEHVRLEVGKNYAPVEFHVPDGEPANVVAFGTDAPHMPRWGTPLLVGPGSIRDAHTDHERIRRADLPRAVQRYVDLARALLAREDVR